jgi:hypothetical protein
MSLGTIRCTKSCSKAGSKLSSNFYRVYRNILENVKPNQILVVYTTVIVKTDAVTPSVVDDMGVGGQNGGDAAPRTTITDDKLVFQKSVLG